MNDSTSNAAPTNQTTAYPEGALAEMAAALANAVTECGTVLFALPAGGLTIQSLQAQNPNMVVIAHVGTSYCVSLPVSEYQVFLDTCGLPDPTAEDIDELKATANAKLSQGFFS